MQGRLKRADDIVKACRNEAVRGHENTALARFEYQEPAAGLPGGESSRLDQRLPAMPIFAHQEMITPQPMSRRDRIDVQNLKLVPTVTFC